MTKLECSAGNCLYNSSNFCCKSDIKVEGSDAEKNSETCCGSFRERGSDTMRNAVEDINHTIDVSCEARACVYNKDCKCDASHIGIAGQNACHCEETECASFECGCSECDCK